MSNFWNDLESQKTINYNGNDMLLAVYNLIIMKSQLDLYLGTGLIPYRNWKVRDINNYFTLPARQTAKVTISYLEYYKRELLN